MTVWKTIDSYKSNSFDPHEVWVRAKGQEPIRASFGWDEEYYDGWSDAWHLGDGSGFEPLGFDPQEWCELDEYKDRENEKIPAF